MRIGIDAKFLTHPQKGGFKTYTENLIMAMASVDKDNEYVLYLDRPPLQTIPVFNQSNFTYRVVENGQRFFGMPWREQFSLPNQIVRDNLDIFHAPCLTAPLTLRVPLVVTIHDMIWYYPTRYSRNEHRINKRKFMEWYYRFVPAIATRRAEAVITVSNASKQCITKYMRIPDNRIFVTLEASKSIYRPILDGEVSNLLVKKYGLKSSYILGVGSADPRKNVKTLIRAYVLLSESFKQTHKLVIVWNHQSLAGEALLEAKRLGVDERVLFLDDVNDEDLALLYNQTSLFVFPSFEEGFGLPALEAMACGAPVLVANNSSMPEIVGDAALQFSAEDVGGLADLMSNVLANPDLQNELSKRGIKRSASFSWENCALETIDVYQRAKTMYRQRG